MNKPTVNVDQIDEKRHYFLREVFLMKVLCKDDGTPIETFSTARELIKLNQKALGWVKIGKYYQFKGSLLKKFVEKQQASFQKDGKTQS